MSTKKRIARSDLYNLHSKIVNSITSLNPRTHIDCSSDLKGCYKLFEGLYNNIKKIAYNFSDTHYIDVVNKSLTQLSLNLKGIVLNFTLEFHKNPRRVDTKFVNIGDVKEDKVIIFDKGRIQEIPFISNKIPISILRKLIIQGLTIDYYRGITNYVITPEDPLQCRAYALHCNPLYSDIVNLIEEQEYQNNNISKKVKFSEIVDPENKNFTVHSNIYDSKDRTVGVLITWDLDDDYGGEQLSTDKIHLPIDHPLSMLIANIDGIKHESFTWKFMYVRIGLRDDQGYILININYPQYSDWVDNTKDFFDTTDKITDDYAELY